MNKGNEWWNNHVHAIHYLGLWIPVNFTNNISLTMLFLIIFWVCDKEIYSYLLLLTYFRIQPKRPIEYTYQQWVIIHIVLWDHIVNLW